MVIYSKHGWQTKPLTADETRVFTLGVEDTGSTDGTGRKYIPALSEVL